MRAFARVLINLTLLAATAATGGWLTTQKVYLHATRDMRTAMLVAVVAFYFVIACVLLAKLKARKPASRPGVTPYAATAKRGR